MTICTTKKIELGYLNHILEGYVPKAHARTAIEKVRTIMTTEKDIAQEMSDDFDECVARGDWNRASLIMNRLWLDTQIFLSQKMNPRLKEINYLKTPLDIGDGKYLLCLIHVDGKKIQLQNVEGTEILIKSDKGGAV